METVFCQYWCWFYMLLVACDYFSCLVMQTAYDLLWWLWSPFASIVLWVPQSPSSHWTAMVDPMGRETKLLEQSLPLSFLFCLSINALWSSSSLSILTGRLLNNGIMPLIGWLSNMVAGLGRPCPSSVICVCNRLCMDWSWNQKTSLVCILQIWCRPPPVHCSDGGKTMRLLALCLDFCRHSWTFLKWNYCQSLTLFF